MNEGLDYKKINRIKACRLEQGKTLIQVATAIGITDGQLSLYENGKRTPRNKKIWQDLASYFNVEVAYIMGIPNGEEQYSLPKRTNNTSLNVGKNIQKRRKELKLTQNELADQASISRSYLADVEGERYDPSLKILCSLAEALGVSVDKLLDKETNWNNPKDLQFKRKIGFRISTIRKSLGLSMDEFGQLFDPPVTRGTISKWENAKYLPNNKRLKFIADIGNVSTDYLINGESTAEESVESQISDILSSLNEHGKQEVLKVLRQLVLLSKVSDFTK